MTSYTEYDYTCKFKDNFQFNELLKYYLYHNYNEKPPSGWQSWYQRYEWSRNDNLLKLNERCEYKKEIWDRNLVIVADIAIESNIPQVIKACYLILKESPSSKEFIENIEYRQLIKLALSGFKPLSSMFMDILNGRLSKLDVFDENLMLALIDSSDSEMYKCAGNILRKQRAHFRQLLL